MKEKQLPKYLQVKQAILLWIKEGRFKSNEMMPSEHNMAKQFDISRQTVRQALSELEQEGRLYRLQGRGTFVSKPRAQNIATIGIMTTYISDYIFPHIVRGAEATLRDRGYRLLLFSTDNDKEKEMDNLKMMLNQPLDGLIIEPTRSAQGNPNIHYYLSLEYQKIPYLMINERYPEMQCPCIKVDDERGGFLAVEHLIQLGHTEIAGFFKMDDLQGVNRLKGFIKAHKKYQVRINPASVIHYTTEEREKKPVESASKLLRLENRPTAFVCYNDQLAVRMLETIRSEGLNVPDDLSLVGFDDSSLATATEVKLTTLTHPKTDMGVKAAESLLSIIENQQPVDDQVYQPELIQRASTRRI